jgi:hypothetical protein
MARISSQNDGRWALLIIYNETEATALKNIFLVVYAAHRNSGRQRNPA